MSQYGNYMINGELVSLTPRSGRKQKTPPGTTRNTTASVAKIMAAVTGIYLIFAAIVFAVSNLI